MGKDPVHAAEDVGQLPLLVAGIGFRSEGQAAGEVLGGGQNVGRPIEGVAAVVNGAARLRWVVDSTQVLPFGSAHLRAGLGGTGGFVGEERNKDEIDFLAQEPTQLV